MSGLMIRNLSVHYGGIAAVQELSLEVHPGERVCVIGANGAGKSSMLKAIAGLVPCSGSIGFSGNLLTAMPAWVRVGQGLCLVPEGRGVFARLTVAENLQMGSYHRRAAASELDDVYAHFPRLFERRTQAAGTLSGGEQQMLAMSRALMLNPEVLLLDEPSMGLAPILVEEVFQIIGRLKAQGMTMLLVEQFAAAALAVADYGYVLENGHIAVHGPAEQLRNDPKVRDAYLGSAH